MPQTASEIYLSEATTQRRGNGTACNASLENMVHCLKYHLCQAESRQLEEENTGPSSETECKLCPRKWQPHGKKCYKAFDQTQRTWNESKEECAKKGAQMLVLHDKKEE
ncbi:Killer cell lectin-like receptor subfamily B member 1B allele A, partial [Varanus komodoensis]